MSHATSRPQRFHRHAPQTGQVLQAACEPLERRALLSLSAAGPEFPVNSFTTSDQSSPAIAADADGDFVVVWQSYAQDGANFGIFAQRYSAAGAARGAEFRVNTFTFGSQRFPAVAMDADGDFVVAWDSLAQDGSSTGIFAQRYSAAGVAQGNEFRVNTFTTGEQLLPAVAMDAGGNFVVAWQGAGAGDSYGVYAQRYNASGTAQGGELHVNTFTTGSQRNLSLAMDADGDFVVAWTSAYQDGSSGGVYAQRFDALGAAKGGEFRVNTVTAGNQRTPSVAMDAGGDFVVAWVGAYDIFAQRYDAQGAPQGGEVPVNTVTAGFQDSPATAMDGNGDLLVAWTDSATIGTGDVTARSFNAAGVAQGGAFRVNTFTTGLQHSPAVGMDANGNTVVAWESAGQDGSPNVYAQRYVESNPDAAAPMIGGVFLNGRRVAPYSAHEPPLQQIVVSFSESLTAAGANGVTNPANWLLTRNGADVSLSISSLTFGFNAATSRHEAVMTFAAPHTSGNFTLVARDAIRDPSGNALDGDLDGAPGGNAALSFAIDALGPIGDQFRVNTYTTDFQTNQVVAMAPDGRFVVTWLSDNQSGSLHGVYAQRYDALGAAQGGETLVAVPLTTTGIRDTPAAAMNVAGDYAITWKNDAEQLGAQRYTSDGTPLGGPIFFVGGVTSSEPKVAVHTDRSFVVTWSAGASNFEDVYAQRFNAAGNAVGDVIAVNSYTPDFQRRAEIAMDADGDFVITWSGRGPASGTATAGDSFAQRYNAQGVPQGGNFQVNDPSALNEAFPRIGMNPGGDFAIAWHRTSGGASFEPGDIYARRFSSDGVPQGAEIPVSTSTSRLDSHPAVAMDGTGGFVVTWFTGANSPNPRDIYARRYDASGTALEGEFRVNTHTTNIQTSPRVAMDADGDFVVTWRGEGSGDLYGIFAQRFANRTPTVATPTVGTLTDSPDPVPAGNAITLSATNVTDDGAVTGVSFYRESNGVAGLQVGFEGDTFLTTQTQFINDAWTAVIPTAGLAGTYTYWAQATDDAGLTGTPASTTNTVIPVAPVVTSWGFQYATLPQRIAYQFNQNVSASLGLDDIVVQQLPGGPTVTPDGLSYHAATNTATFTFNAPLPDGRYRARLIASGINGPGGPPMAADHVFEFTFLRGDANGDGQVNLNDFNILAANFGQSNRNFTQGDFDYSGTVNLADFNILASRFGMSAGPAGIETDRRERGEGEDLRDKLGDLLD